jgi:hypothetical protein
MNDSDKRVIVKKGYSRAPDEAEAVGELAQQIEQPDASVTVFFASSAYDLKRLAEEVKRSFREPVVGCTTSGEITPAGYTRGTVSGFSIASKELQVFPYLFPSLREFNSDHVGRIVRSMQDRLSHSRREKPEARAFGLLLVDGLSLMEERIIAILGNAVEDVPIAGGSAGDDLKLEKTHVYTDGTFVSDAALFALFITTLPFKVIKTQHFTPSDQRLVITKADPEKRIVYEINGRSAAQEYAKMIGMEVGDLRHLVYFASPLMLRVGGEYYVRSIQKINADGGLTFFSAIDEGLVLRVAERKNLVENLKDAFDQVRTEVPNIGLTIGFDCILRRLEVMDNDLQHAVNDILTENNVIGFSTYGEQFKSVHVNQTFTGIVLGE